MRLVIPGNNRPLAVATRLLFGDQADSHAQEG